MGATMAAATALAAGTVPMLAPGQPGGGVARHGCAHYQRHCEIKAECCGRFYPCRRCHDDDLQRTCGAATMDRHAVKSVRCCHCKLEQVYGEECRRCGVRFGKYFCPTCKFYDNDTSKAQFHCDGCGLCRVGGRENFIHCDKCCVCYHADRFHNHQVRRRYGPPPPPLPVMTAQNMLRAIRVIPFGFSHRCCRPPSYTDDRRSAWKRQRSEIAPSAWSFCTRLQRRSTSRGAGTFSIKSASTS